MGASEGKSMLYLEARCIAVTRAAGAQGVQNGGIDGVNVTASVPDGMREVIAENLCVMLHDLESCTGNDTLMSASDIRRTAHTLPLLLAGSDFLFSGFGSIPAYDNAFGPSNMNAEDLDDYLVVQRDWGFEGGLRWRDDAELLPLPAAGGRGLPRSLRGARPRRVHGRGRRRVRAARTGASTSRRCRASCPALRPERIMDARHHRARRRARTRRTWLRGRGRARARDDAASDCSETSCRRLRSSTRTCTSSRPSPTRTTTRGRARATACPPSGGSEVARVRQVWSPDDGRGRAGPSRGLHPPASRSGRRGARVRPDEVVVGLSPAFGDEIWAALNGMTVAEVLRQVLAGIEEEGLAVAPRPGPALDRSGLHRLGGGAPVRARASPSVSRARERRSSIAPTCRRSRTSSSSRSRRA